MTTLDRDKVLSNEVCNACGTQVVTKVLFEDVDADDPIPMMFCDWGCLKAHVDLQVRVEHRGRPPKKGH